jgi:hypothetical protein
MSIFTVYVPVLLLLRGVKKQLVGSEDSSSLFGASNRREEVVDLISGGVVSLSQA